MYGTAGRADKPSRDKQSRTVASTGKRPQSPNGPAPAPPSRCGLEPTRTNNRRVPAAALAYPLRRSDRVHRICIAAVLYRSIPFQKSGTGLQPANRRPAAGGVTKRWKGPDRGWCASARFDDVKQVQLIFIFTVMDYRSKEMCYVILLITGPIAG